MYMHFFKILPNIFAQMMSLFPKFFGVTISFAQAFIQDHLYLNMIFCMLIFIFQFSFQSIAKYTPLLYTIHLQSYL